jgi:hypothetical protein
MTTVETGAVTAADVVHRAHDVRAGAGQDIDVPVF